MWRIKENFPIIDLGDDYYIAKIQNKENMLAILQHGPWFIFGHFLGCQRWVPNFVPEAK